MRILLFKSGLNDGSQHEMPSLGMGIIAATIKKTGHTVDVYDGHMLGNTNRVPEGHEVIFISAVSMENIPEFHSSAYWPKTQFVVLGGPHAYSYHDLLVDDRRFDRIVVGEGDGQFGTIMDSKDKVVFLGNRPAEEMLAPDYSDFIGKDDMKGYSTYTSRGCTNVCSFCQSGKAHGRYRVRDTDSIIAEFETIRNFVGVRTVHIIDDAFTGNIGHAKWFLDFYLSKEYDRLYKLNIFNVRADQLDDEILALMKRCGIVNLPIGVESADPTVYRYVGKGETLDDIREGIERIRKHGIIPFLNMIIGLPHDTPEGVDNSIRWVQSIPDPKIAHWFIYSPFRGTRAYDFLVKQGAIKDGFIPEPYGRRYDHFPWDSDIETPDFTKEQRGAAQIKAFLSCNSPILVNSMQSVTEICMKHGMLDLLSEWLKNAPIENYWGTSRPDKISKGQL
jgi:radical SAM superfamily enzyme YgiQ (UPF0313 family)